MATAGERHHLDFVDLTGRSVWVYGQTEVQKDLVAAAHARGQEIHYEVSDTALHDLETDRPSVTFTDASGVAQRLEADVVVGCDGSFGPSRGAVPESLRRTWEKVYPYSWLGILADVAPSTDELIYAWHPDGFAMHSMRSATVSRLYLQVPNDTPIDEWSDDRIWDALATRLGHGQDGWTAHAGTDHREVACCRCARSCRPRCGTAGCSWPATPRTSCRRPAPRGSTSRSPTSACSRRRWWRCCARGTTLLAAAYSDTALRRVWRCTHFSWWMTTMLHTSGDPFDAELQLSQLRWVTSSEAGATGLAENYAGLPIGF